MSKRKPARRRTIAPVAKHKILHTTTLQESAQQAQRSLSLDANNVDAFGFPVPSGIPRVGDLEERERKEALLQAYIEDIWVSSPIEAIAKRVTSGKWSIEQRVKDVGSEQDKQTLIDFFGYINEHWDFLQFMRSLIVDLLIFGECYVEIVRKDGTPSSLHKVDCLTMTCESDRHGNITRYIQQMTPTDTPVYFQPEDIIRWWFPHPKSGMTALSPIEKIINAVYIDRHMTKWQETFFRKGAKAPFAIETLPDAPQDIDKRTIRFFKDEYTGEKNAHVPIVMPIGTKIVPLTGNGAIDIDFQKGREVARTEKLAGFGVPPQAVGIVETAQLGSGSGESQNKMYQYNTVEPIRQMLLEKLNFRVAKQGFGIADWMIAVSSADYRDDESMANIADKRIRNGTSTQNEERTAMGKLPYEPENGTPVGNTPALVTSKEITPLNRIDSLSAEQAQSAQLDIETKQVAVDTAKHQLEQAKKPPETLPQGQQTPDSTQTDNTNGNTDTSSKNGSQAQSDDDEDEEDTKESVMPNFL